MSGHEFYVAYIRFVSGKTERQTAEISQMMDKLAAFADQVEAGQEINVAASDARPLGRGLAGVAGFLQQHILPEAVAADNAAVEQQVRWVIDTSMSLMATLMVHAETESGGSECHLTLPAPPGPTG